MRGLIKNLIVDGLTSSVEAPAPEHWYGSGSVPDSPPHPFAEIRFGGTFPGIGRVRRRRLEIWIHDDEGDYGVIEKILSQVREILDGAAHVTDAAGNELILCTWKSTSTDLFDDGYRTNCMMDAYEFIGREAQ